MCISANFPPLKHYQNSLMTATRLNQKGESGFKLAVVLKKSAHWLLALHEHNCWHRPRSSTLRLENSKNPLAVKYHWTPSFVVWNIHKNRWHPSPVKNQWHRTEIKETHAQAWELLKWRAEQQVTTSSHREKRLCQKGATTSCPWSLQWGYIETSNDLIRKYQSLHSSTLPVWDSGHFECGGWFIDCSNLSSKTSFGIVKQNIFVMFPQGK